MLSLEQAVPFALIVNELVTNALVHAFEAGGRGRLHPGEPAAFTAGPASAGRRQSTGIGISAEPLQSASGGTGLDLVRMLARQLDASLEVDHVQGTTFRVAFKDAAAGAISS